MLLKKIYPVLLLFLLVSCVGKDKKQVMLPNERQGKLSPTMKLINISEKKIALDSSTAVRTQFMEMFIDSEGRRNLTFLNTYNKSLYIYDYETTEFLRSISFENLQLPHLLAYHIKNLDSIYLFNRQPSEMKLVNNLGENIADISLTGGSLPKDASWLYRYPQFYPRTVTPIIQHNGQLLFSGEYMTSIPDSIIDNYKFTANISLTDNQVTFTNKYPKNLYGNGINWGAGGLFNNVYYDINPERNLFITSFPVSHHVYLTDLKTGKIDSVYAGSNIAGDITSFPYPKGGKGPSGEELIEKVSKTTLYTAILYDKFRDIYYRFILKSIPDAKKGTDWKEKVVAVILFDRDFKYLGETDLDILKKVNWENSFVTKEGLNIEFTEVNDLSEEFLTLKIFEPIKI